MIDETATGDRAGVAWLTMTIPPCAEIVDAESELDTAPLTAIPEFDAAVVGLSVVEEVPLIATVDVDETVIAPSTLLTTAPIIDSPCFPDPMGAEAIGAEPRIMTRWGWYPTKRLPHVHS
jgi:hypothetical protein